jgi:peptidoglycan/LPS O-acetylase OafA/YrhL
LAIRFIEFIKTKNKKDTFLFIVALLGCIAISTFIPLGFLKYFPIWILGAVIRLIPISKTKSLSINNIVLLIFSISILMIAIAYSNLKMALLTYYFVGVSFSWVLLLLGSLRLQVFEDFFIRIKEPVKLFSDFSFSLYALHYPFQLLLLSIITDVGILIPLKRADLQGWIYLLLIMSIVYVYSYIIYYFFTERNTGYVRNQMFLLYKKYNIIFNKN